MNESQRWVEFGHFLAEQRERLGLTRRDAAKRAAIPERVWRELETGQKQSLGGIRLLPNPHDDVLQRMAEALELPADALVHRVNKVAPAKPRRGRANNDHASLRLVGKISNLSDRDRVLVEQLVDSMLEHG